MEGQNAFSDKFSKVLQYSLTKVMKRHAVTLMEHDINNFDTVSSQKLEEEGYLLEFLSKFIFISKSQTTKKINI